MTDSETLKKLDEMESRLDRLENSTAPDKKVIIEERTEIAGEGEFEGSDTSKKDQSIIKTKRIALCDHCNDQLGNDFAVCHKDGKKLCKKCSVVFRNRINCPQCIRGMYPLSRHSFKVLLLIANSICNVNDVHTISHVPKKEIKDSVQFLLEGGYIEKAGFFGYKATEMGFEALSVYAQLYGGTGDMQELDEELKGFVSERF